jgi:hypothetical protein
MKNPSAKRFKDKLKEDCEKYPNARFKIKNVVGRDTDEEACRRFLSRNKNIDCATTSPLYALPTSLINSMEKMFPALGTTPWSFERDLAAFCSTRDAVGIVDNSFVTSLILNPLPMPRVSRDEFDELGWGGEMKFAAVAKSLKSGEERLAPFHDHGQAYCGWLTTNPEFQSELSELREHRDIESQRRSFEYGPDKEYDEVFEAFLRRWLLVGFSSWDLPLPQGPNLSSVVWPAGARDPETNIQLSIPVTMPLQSRYPLKKMIEEIRQIQTPPHLREWVDITQSQGGSKWLGAFGYGHVFPLHFYRNIVLKSRHGDRFRRSVERIDEVLAKFLGKSEELVKKLRLAIDKRLGGGKGESAKRPQTG